MQKVLCFVAILVKTVILWPNHDISTLKILQVVHRHGDRTPNTFLANDPYKNMTMYWPEGKAELTKEGKIRMFKLGQFVRREYDAFLGDQYSPREVYARSSISSRCLESVSLVLAGAYPPYNPKWQWIIGVDAEIGRLWQPIRIETTMPKNKDLILNDKKDCSKAEEEVKKILESEEVVKALEENKDFLTELSKTVGTDMNVLKNAKTLFSDLTIEHSRGLNWSAAGIWEPEYEAQVYSKVKSLAELHWNVMWDNNVIEKVRAGPLIEELVLKNFDGLVKGKPIKNSVGQPYKMFVYGTHDTKLAVLMNALDIFNRKLIPFGAMILFELHQESDSQDYFVKVFYHNQTMTADADPYLMTLPQCDHKEKCPFDTFLKISEGLIPSDWNGLCELDSRVSNSDSISFNIMFLMVPILSKLL